MMSEEEQDQIGDQLKKGWPRSFSPELLETYVRKLRGLAYTAVSTAIADHQADSKYRPFCKDIVRRVMGPGSGSNAPTNARPGSTGSQWADTLKTQWAADGKHETQGYNALQCFCRYLRGWYGARVLRHSRATERSRSDHADPDHIAAAGIALANDQLKRETVGLHRHGKTIFQTDGRLTDEHADLLAKLVLGSRADYESALVWARDNCTVAAVDETGPPEADEI